MLWLLGASISSQIDDGEGFLGFSFISCFASRHSDRETDASGQNDVVLNGLFPPRGAKEPIWDHQRRINMLTDFIITPGKATCCLLVQPTWTGKHEQREGDPGTKSKENPACSAG